MNRISSGAWAIPTTPGIIDNIFRFFTVSILPKNPLIAGAARAGMMTVCTKFVEKLFGGKHILQPMLFASSIVHLLHGNYVGNVVGHFLRMSVINLPTYFLANINRFFNKPETPIASIIPPLLYFQWQFLISNIFITGLSIQIIASIIIKLTITTFLNQIAGYKILSPFVYMLYGLFLTLNNLIFYKITPSLMSMALYAGLMYFCENYNEKYEKYSYLSHFLEYFAIFFLPSALSEASNL